MEPVLDLGQLIEQKRSAPAPTVDDVSVTADGRRLDTPEKLVAFLMGLEAERADGGHDRAGKPTTS